MEILIEILKYLGTFILGGGLMVFLTAKAKKAEAEANTDKVEMDNFRTGTNLLMEQIVKPLKKEMGDTRREVIKLRRAVECISDCAHATQCPVRAELKRGVETPQTDKQ